MGLVQEVVPAEKALKRALEIASAMSTYPQGAIRNDRRAALEGLTLSLPEGLEHEAEVHRDTARDPAMAEWLARFAKGERPEPIGRLRLSGNAHAARRISQQMQSA
jgi:enoyl-CoA hydratase